MNANNPSLEYQAATTKAALFDLADRVHVQLEGRDRQAFLHNFCTNDVKRLRPGDGCEAFVPSIKGRILGHVFIFCREDTLLLDSVAGSDAFLMQHFDRYIITEDVALRNRTSELAGLFLTGPAAARIVHEALGVAVDDLAMCAHRSVSFEFDSLIIARTPFLSQPGFLLIGPRDQARSISDSLAARGAIPAGRDLFESLRIEAGFPLFGADLTDDMLAQEAGRTQQAISFTKGCYLGQEPIARLDSLGHANRMLRGLRLDSGAAPASGTTVLDESGQETIGAITSSAVSYADGHPVALALLKFKHAAPGTRVVVQGGESTQGPATVFWN